MTPLALLAIAALAVWTTMGHAGLPRREQRLARRRATSAILVFGSEACLALAAGTLADGVAKKADKLNKLGYAKYLKGN